jgi:uncharacterized protein YbbC (DUF1343 family)
MLASLLYVGCGGSAAHQEARPGIDVLLADSSHLIEGRRVGLITNHTGIDQFGLGDVDRLIDAGVNLTALFAPEHGFRGNLEQAVIEHGRDSAGGLPVFSLYGEVRAPTPEMLRLVDVLLIDLQDIGGRPYTYISTALLAMEASAAQEVRVLILDRPNPIGGTQMQGPMLDTAFASFIGMLPVPLRHGMSLGELALMGNALFRYGADVTAVPALGWRRDVWFDATGLPWVRPSPNMPDLESATHYPGLVLFEGTNLSVGRGTAVAFRVLAAPWLDPDRVIGRLGTEPGVTILDSVITPRNPGDRKYPDAELPALLLRVNERSSYDPTRLAARLMAAIREIHPDSFQIRDARYFDNRAGSDALRLWLESGGEEGDLWRSWEEGLAAFRAVREKYLIY